MYELGIEKSGDVLLFSESMEMLCVGRGGVGGNVCWRD